MPCLDAERCSFSLSKRDSERLITLKVIIQDSLLEIHAEHHL